MADITIKDVAREVGVSISTVSKVLNNKGRVGGETRRKVLKAVETLNYTCLLYTSRIISL